MYYQQGDVLLKKINSLPDGEIKKENKIILAEGEATGHCHAMTGNLSVMKKDGEVFVKVDGEQAEVIHQEHDAILIDPGIYKIEKVREYDHFAEEAREIAD